LSGRKKDTVTKANTVELHLTGYWLSGSPIIRTLVIRIANYPDAGYADRQLSGRWLSGSQIIRMLVMRIANYPDRLYP
jgi:hypothetical protein